VLPALTEADPAGAHFVLQPPDAGVGAGIANVFEREVGNSPGFVMLGRRTVRTFYADPLVDGAPYPSFARAVVDSYRVSQGLRIGAADARPRPLPYFGLLSGRRVPVYSGATFVADVAAGRISPEWVRGKLVLIGAAYRTSDGADTFGTPFGPARRLHVHANTINALLRNDGLRFVPTMWPWFIALLTFAAAVTAGWRAPARPWLGVLLVLGLLLLAACALLLLDFVLPLGWPFRAWLVGSTVGLFVIPPPLPSLRRVPLLNRLSRRAAPRRSTAAETAPPAGVSASSETI